MADYSKTFALCFQVEEILHKEMNKELEKKNKELEEQLLNQKMKLEKVGSLIK